MTEFFNRRLPFSGYEWLVKSTRQPEGPGPNWFSDDDGNVRVDSEGHLHLRIEHREKRWYCAEVVCGESLGHGRYLFQVSAGAETINENAVLGLFTWDTDPEYANREMDVEISRWGEVANDNAQFVIFPLTVADKCHRFNIEPGSDGTTHIIDWRQDRISYRSLRGDADGKPIHSWEYAAPDIHPPGNENARINLWLYRGAPPSDGQEIEVVVSRFQFVP
jgi:hypothetical protein